jgi:hypothetical protein
MGVVLLARADDRASRWMAKVQLRSDAQGFGQFQLWRCA